MRKRIKIYYLYENKQKETKFIGRYASRRNLESAVRSLGLVNWFYEEEEKEDRYQ